MASNYELIQREMISGETQAYHHRLSRKEKLLIFLCALLSMLILFVDSIIPLGVAFGVSYVVVILLTSWLPGRRSTAFTTIACSLLVVVGLYLSPPSGVWWMVVLNRVLSVMAIWVAAVFVIRLKSHSEKLYSTEKQFRTLFESVAESIIVTNAQGVIQHANSKVFKVFGYTSDELIGQPIELLIPDGKKVKHRAHQELFVRRTTERPREESKCLHAKHKDGSIFPVEISLNQFKIDGELSVLALVADITKRTEYIDALTKEKKTAQMYLDIAGTIFVLIDNNKNVQLINQKGCEILGYPEEEIIGKNWFEHFVPRSKKRLVADIYELLMNGESEEYVYYHNPILTKNGEQKLISWNNTIIRDESGQITGTLSSGEDITKQEEVKNKLVQLNSELEQKVRDRTAELEESQLQYKIIARNFPNGDISVLDRELNYVFVEGTEMYKRGITGDMLVGTSFLDRIDETIQDDIEQKLLPVFEGLNTNFEFKRRSETFMISAVGIATDVGNDINQILMVSQNITSLKRAEEEIQRSLEKERHLNELKSRFVSMASHEFRTPLTAVLNSVSLLSKYIGTTGREEKQKNHINRIKSSVQHLATILNDFLSLDKLEEGKVEIICSELNVPEFSQELVDVMSDMAKRGQQITYQHQGETQVSLDRQMLNIMLTNLLSNAIKYSSEDSVIVFKTEVHNGLFTTSVQDEGIGIPKEEQNHLFERFFRAKNAVNIQGTGLGLNIVKKYAEMAGGKIEFESTHARGTTFIVKLPLNDKK